MKAIHVMAPGATLFDTETREVARKKLQKLIAHMPAEKQAQYLASFESVSAESDGKTIERASADSCIEVLRGTASDLGLTIDATITIAKSADQGPMRKGPVTFLLGEASGYIVSACQCLASAATTIEKAMETLAEMRAHEAAEKKPDKTEH